MTLSRGATLTAALRIERPHAVSGLVANLVLTGALALVACHHRSADDEPPPVAPGALEPMPVIAPAVALPAPPPAALADTTSDERTGAPGARTVREGADSAGPSQADVPPAAPLTDADRARARRCTMDADHACVIRLLEGRAETESDLAMLIEACRASGQTDRALRYMRIYLERYPTRPRARGYQMIIARSG